MVQVSMSNTELPHNRNPVVHVVIVEAVDEEAAGAKAPNNQFEALSLLLTACVCYRILRKYSLPCASKPHQRTEDGFGKVRELKVGRNECFLRLDCFATTKYIIRECDPAIDSNLSIAMLLK